MGHVYKRGKIYWIKYYRDGRPFYESSGSPKETFARNLLKQREGEVAMQIPVTPKMGKLRFADLAGNVVNDYRVNGKKSIDDVERRFRKHLLPFFGRKLASSISTADVRRFIDRRQEAGASNAEINRELAAFKRAYSLAIKDGQLRTRPYIPFLKENNVRKGFFTRSEMEAVCQFLSPPLNAVVRFAFITGWRIRSEVLTLQWRQVDLEAGRVILDPGTTKNDQGRVFPFTIELRKLLDSQLAVAKKLQQDKGVLSPWVFHRDGARIKDLYSAWRTACRKAGLPGKLLHDFRRTAVRNLIRASIPERVAMHMTGHKTRSVFERYNIVSESDLTAAAERLDLVADGQ
jgi:integrase